MNTNDFEIKDNILIKYYGDSEEAAVPDGVECIATGAFENCEALKHLMIPESVTQIEPEAVHNCRNLEDITLYHRRMPMLKFHMPFVRFFCDIEDVLEHGADNFLRVCINGEIMPYRELGYHRHEYVFELMKDMPDSENFKKMLIDYADVFLYCLLNDELQKSDAVKYQKDTKEEIFQRMIDARLFTESNIDACIAVTFEMNSVNIRAMLMDYKYQYLEFGNPADKLKL